MDVHLKKVEDGHDGGQVAVEPTPCGNRPTASRQAVPTSEKIRVPAGPVASRNIAKQKQRLL